MSLWDRLCIHACYHPWNPIWLILNDDWIGDVLGSFGETYPGWKELR
ncbi:MULTISPECIES: hypothetical protein [Salipiger]|uniref:Uncharacterized protein n=1 Tax=Salipiger profundus TaxID=1229727 RepID=A0A1U7CZF6_9RHOB|nr:MULTISPECIES: hypothetical protein [Salipiger]ALF02064.1 hypothetical protein vBThpSP1_025 [Thiobacimonas phage vB_ThpS-P1]APX21287.1 hypothetical protein Ga0080559_TMP491 [Salipiger profundus]GGA03525.1 hypothetical protein GCM10011326_13640 [Salipiger profundus]